MSDFDESKHNRGDDGKFGTKDHLPVTGVDLNGGDEQPEPDAYLVNDHLRVLTDENGGALSDEALDDLTHIVIATIRDGKAPKLAPPPAAAPDLTIDDVPEPDQDDYEYETKELVEERSGLRNWDHGKDTYWNSEGSETLGFSASGTIGVIDKDYLSPDMASKIDSLPSGEHGREVHFQVYADRNDSLAADRNQYVSVNLSEAEQTDVVRYLDDEYGRDFTDDKVAFWSSGDPAGMQKMFGFVSPHKEWDKITAAVKGVPTVWRAKGTLEVAEDFHADLRRQHTAEMDHIGSDEWKEGRLEDMEANRQ